MIASANAASDGLPKGFLKLLTLLTTKAGSICHHQDTDWVTLNLIAVMKTDAAPDQEGFRKLTA